MSLMQPYFFPYFEQFRHMCQCDLWVVFDTVRYECRTWMSRNRILNRHTGWSYVTVPIHRSARHGPVSDAEVTDDWDVAIREKLLVYQHASPRYQETMELFDRVCSQRPRTLGTLNFFALAEIKRFLNIDTELVKLSELNLTLPSPPPTAGEWGHFVTRELKADVYSNASGGRGLIKEDLFQPDGIDLRFYEHLNLRYDTGPLTFVPDLSILDTLMWVDRAELQALVHT
ncbi:MAG: WbqC family protein [Hyphomicrobiales bacterium]|nr:WbqC family protein [Hyphomicrobiales bacterium]